MEADLEPPNSSAATTATATATATAGDHFLSSATASPSHGHHNSDQDVYVDSNCSTPYVSAPSSPGRSFPAAVGFFYSAPASPMHYVLATAPARSSATAAFAPAASDASSSGSFEFEFSARFDSPAPEIGSSMSSADELFLNGQIRPMKLSAHLQRPQALAPLIDSEGENDDDDEDVFQRSRDLRLRNRSQRRRTRSLSPLRSTMPYDWLCSDDASSSPVKAVSVEGENGNGGGHRGSGKERRNETTPSGSASSSRCSSAGRSSKRWVFLKDFLRSKSEGRSNNKFWHNISFSPAKEKKGRERGSNVGTAPFLAMKGSKESPKAKKSPSPASGGKPSPSPAKRRSAHEMHYTANRAQAEEMRKKTFLPYRQGLLGCLGFNSKSYGALNGFARALNPVSSR